MCGLKKHFETNELRSPLPNDVRGFPLPSERNDQLFIVLTIVCFSAEVDFAALW